MVHTIRSALYAHETADPWHTNACSTKNTQSSCHRHSVEKKRNTKIQRWHFYALAVKVPLMECSVMWFTGKYFSMHTISWLAHMFTLHDDGDDDLDDGVMVMRRRVTLRSAKLHSINLVLTFMLAAIIGNSLPVSWLICTLFHCSFSFIAQSIKCNEIWWLNHSPMLILLMKPLKWRSHSNRSPTKRHSDWKCMRQIWGECERIWMPISCYTKNSYEINECGIR